MGFPYLREMFRIVFIFTALILKSSAVFSQSALYPSNGTLFDDKLHSINIIIPENDFTALQHPDSLWNNKRYPITFVYDEKDTVKQATIRLKGNTSRSSAKKSFRIDFDKIIDNQTYQDLETIYIHGNHNDASMMREFLSAYVMRQMGVPCNRANHVKLYINGEYYGLRSLVEYVDKDFLKTRFGTNKGNNYKCTWPADLAWLGSSEQSYKDVINPSPERERAYDLKTNEDEDDYSRLVSLIDLINNRQNESSFSQEIEAIFNVDGYLKALAAEVLIGHWDNYYYNKNNYFIYDHPNTGKFTYIPYDMDNTYGVQWGVNDINKRNIHNWGNSNVNAPLTESILAQSAYKKQFEGYIFQAIETFYNEKHMFPLVDSLYQKLENAISLDPQYRGELPSTYGYTVNDWKNSIDKGLGDHNTYGIKPFIAERVKSAKEQFLFNHSLNTLNKQEFTVFPNPGNSTFSIKTNSNKPLQLQIKDVNGSCIREVQLHNLETFDASELSPGVYFISNESSVIKWIKSM